MIKLKNIRYVIKPNHFLGLLLFKIYQIFHPDHPWLSPKSIQFLDKTLNSSMKGFEWGSGRSTLWFGARLESLLSIENNREWYKIVEEKIKQSGFKNIECRLIPTTDNETHPPYVSAISLFDDNTLDFIVIDGHYRKLCVPAALSKLKVHGFLLIDNSNWLPINDWGVPKNWPIVHQSDNWVTQTTIWEKI